jgi:3-oxoacyl-[acyl-carrier-protein] synthase-3
MIIGTGHAVPSRVLTNADLEKIVETSDQWIVERTGIRERRVVEPGTPLSALAIDAAKRALADAGTDAGEIDLIVLGSVTGDLKFPATACLIQEAIGAKNAVAFDLSAACSGFLYSLQVAAAMMAVGRSRRALVIGGDVLTSMVDWTDRDTCVLFGDGAGAVVLAPSSEGRGILSSTMRSDGGHAQLLYNAGGGSLHPPTVENLEKKLFAIRMEGREVFRHAVTSMSDALKQVLSEAELTLDQIDLVIPHQANLRIIEAVGKRCAIPAEKVYVNVERFGNTSAGSIPIAIDEARRAGRIHAGSTVAFVTFGAGFTWAAAIIRF